MEQITTFYKSSSWFSIEEALTQAKERYLSTWTFQSKTYQCMPYYHIIIWYDKDQGYSIKLWDNIKNTILRWVNISSTNKQSLLEPDVYTTLKGYGFKGSSEDTQTILQKNPDFENDFWY